MKRKIALNLFLTNVPLLYPLKTSEKLRFSDVFRRYRSGTLVENRLKNQKFSFSCVFQMDPTYQPSLMERRTLFGLQLEQKRNDAVLNTSLFSNIVSQNKEVIHIK